MPVRTRSQTKANNAPAPEPKPKAKSVYVRTLHEKTEEQKKADKEYERQTHQRYIERRNKIIEENNYANSEVFAVLREARQALSKDTFISLVFLLDALSFDGNYLVLMPEYKEEEALVLLPWFRRLFDLLASGKTTFELTYVDEDDDDDEYNYYPRRVTFNASWEHMDDMVRLHFTKIFPVGPWDPPFSKIVF